ATVSIICLPTRSGGHDLPTRRVRHWPLSNCAPNARMLLCTLGATLNSLRRCALSRWCCNCPHLCKSAYVLGWDSISTKFRNGNDLSATEGRTVRRVCAGLPTRRDCPKAVSIVSRRLWSGGDEIGRASWKGKGGGG